MEKQAFFSIVMATWNREKFLPAAIDSVLKQKFTDWELIIVDDGSTDNTKKVVAEFTDKRIRYIYQENKERSAARNNGVAHSKGEYICFLDSDDYYLDNHLEVLYLAVSNNKFPVGFFCTGSLLKEGEKITKHPVYTDKKVHPVKFVLHNFILMNSICVHHEIFKSWKFIEDQNIFEDTNLWMRILARYPFYPVLEFTNVCVQHDARSGERLFKDANLKILKQYIRNIENAFEDEKVQKIITEKERKKYIKSKYIMAAYAAIWVRKFSALRYILRQLVMRSPGFLFEKTFYKIEREALAMRYRKLKGKRS
jgi:glycosyltransferase involved in cell wall biosynthesis